MDDDFIKSMVADLRKGEKTLLLPKELFDFIEVLRFGANKYGSMNWLEPNGVKSDRKQMLDSAFHHLADAWAGKKKDNDSGLHPLLHLASRAMMLYTREMRGLVHEKDMKE